MDRELISGEEMIEVEELPSDKLNSVASQPENAPVKETVTQVPDTPACGPCRADISEITSHIIGNNRPLTPAGWIGVNLCMLIPPLNVLLLFLWACGGTERTNLKNYARGVLLTVVLLALVFLVAVVVADLLGVPVELLPWRP